MTTPTPDNRYMSRSQAQAADIDVGLRSYMLQVYNYMASGIALTGIVAYIVANTPAVRSIVFGGPQVWLFMLAPLGVVLFLSVRVQHMKASTAQAMFWLYAGLVGISVAAILLSFTGESVARVFFITAGTFGAMSLYGYTTKRDLSRMGSFLMMGLIGVVIASVVNIFIGSTALQFAVSVIGVLVFVGLTAYDTQQIKEMYAEGDDSEIYKKKSIMGALRLYLDFINLFMLLMQLFGQRRE
jgi:FtsH-binding integral membrane protein